MDIMSLTARQYTAEESRIATEALSPEGVVVLDQVRAALGWPSIKSLATKYYAAFPYYDRWQTALRRTLFYSRRPNIAYLLKTLESIGLELERKAYSGRQSLSRLSSRLEGSIRKDGTLSRLQSTPTVQISHDAGDLRGPLAKRVLATMGAAA